MRITFYKYHGTGNDFVLIDNRDALLTGNENAWFAAICHRHFGIGADGVILLNSHPDFDFEMDYFNSDGQRSSMCGNGGRCMARFAADLGLVSDSAVFIAIDGPHEAKIDPETIQLKMTLPHEYHALQASDYFIHTGSPHFVRFLPYPLSDFPVVAEGRAIRKAWSNEGTNVNFAFLREDGGLDVRTYERGVEDETLSCGTGVTAVAEVLCKLNSQFGAVQIHTPGGHLTVHVTPHQEPWLQGPAKFVYKGEIDGPI